MKIHNENLKFEVKRKMYKWTLGLLAFIDQLPKHSSTQIIARQLLRSGTSICANYIEAQSASSKKDFANFLHYSLKSANETKFWLALLRDSNKGSKEDLNLLLAGTQEIGKILGASLLTIKGKRKI